MADIDHLTELFAPLGGVSFRRMFSGYCVMKEGAMFALISRDILYFRTDDAGVVRYKAESAPQWQPHMRGKTMTTMPYWQTPERLFDEPDEFVEWAREAFAIAKRHKAEKAKPKPKPKPAKKAAKAAATTAQKPAKPGVATKKPTAKKKTAPKRR